MQSFPYETYLAHEIAALRAYLNFYQILDQPVKRTVDNGQAYESEVVKALIPLRSKRRLFFVAFTVSLYGALEEFIEKLAEDYVNTNVRVSRTSPKPTTVNEAIIKSHYARSLECLNKPDDPRYGGQRQKSDLLKEMLHGLDRVGHDITGDVFRAHSKNFRFENIESLFTEIGLSSVLQTACGTPDLKRALAPGPVANTGASTNTEGGHKHVSLLLRNLVDARNRAAHGKLRDIDGADTMKKWLDLIELLGLRLQHLCLDELVSIYISTRSSPVLRCTEKYQKGHVLVLTSTEPLALERGMVLVARRDVAPRTKWCPVLELKDNNVTVNNLTLMPSGEVGIRIDGFKGQTSYDYHIFASKDWTDIGFPLVNSGALSGFEEEISEPTTTAPPPSPPG